MTKRKVLRYEDMQALLHGETVPIGEYDEEIIMTETVREWLQNERDEMSEGKNCGHPGTIHLANDPDGADEQCKVCGSKLDIYGNEVSER